jgi:hypothetical protein
MTVPVLEFISFTPLQMRMLHIYFTRGGTGLSTVADQQNFDNNGFHWTYNKWNVKNSNEQNCHPSYPFPC